MSHTLGTIAALGAIVLSALAQAAPVGAPERPVDGDAAASPSVVVAGQRMGVGCVPMTDEELRLSPRIRVLTSRGNPAAVLLDTSLLPPVAAQGSQNSCVAWAAAYYCSSYLWAKRKQIRKPDLLQPRWQLSPAFVYNLRRVGDGDGMSVGGAFALLRDTGCATLFEMPYDPADATRPPTPEAYKRAVDHKLAKAGVLMGTGSFNPEAARTYLSGAGLPIVVGIPLYTDFADIPVAEGYVYQPGKDATTEKARDGKVLFHAVTIIGYDTAKNAFRIVNSWGENWGDHGFAWIDAKFMESSGRDAWCVKPTSLVPRGINIDFEEPAPAPGG